MPRRRYTHNDRAKAVADAEVNGAEHAAQTTGIPRTTILYWLDAPEFVELRQKTREEKRDGYRVIIARAQQRLVELIPTMEPRDLTVLLGVSQDKDLLLSGDATARSEVNTFNGYNDHEKRAIAGLLRRATAENGAEGAAALDAERAGVEAPSEAGATST